MNVYKKVDARILKSGKIRLRFKLSEEALAKVKEAFEMTGFKYPCSSLDAICLDFLAGAPSSLSLDSPAEGSERFLVRLHRDQYETFKSALQNAGKYSPRSDSEALVMICECFIAAENLYQSYS